MTRKKTILISGYYGFNNSGDDAILEAIVKAFKEKSRDIDLVALSNNPALTERVYGIRAVNRFNIIEVRRAIKDSDLFISGGGSLLQDVTSTRSLLYYLSIMNMAKRLGKKVMVYANGVGPIKSKFNRILTKKVLDKVDLISLRDQDSKDLVEALDIDREKVYLTADPVFSLEGIDRDQAFEIFEKEAIERDKPLVGISIREWTDDENLLEVLAKVLNRLADKYDFKALLIPMHYPDDLDISRLLLDRLEVRSFILQEKYEVRELMGLVNELDLIVGMRLHTLIYAATQNTPMVGLVYDPKVESFLKSVDMDYMVDLDDLDEDRLYENIDYVMSNSKELECKLKSMDEFYRKKALDNVDMALSLLDK